MADLATFTPIFEETETAIKDRIIGRIPEKWRKQPGDFIHDAAVPAAPEVQQLKINQDFILKNSFALFAEGIYLDYRAAEADVYRYPATQSKGVLSITASIGTTLPKGHNLLTVILDKDKNPITVTVDADVYYNDTGAKDVAVTTTGYGEIMNVPAGSEWVLSPTIVGVQTIAQLTDFAYGTDKESDDSLRARWIEQRRKTRRSGNKQDYISWALEVEGVGMSKCIPLWAGRGTVKVIIANTNKQPASADLVQAVQLHIDPDQTGEGNGVAPVGAIVTVESAVDLDINVVADITLESGSTIEQATAEFKKSLAAYLETLAFKDNVNELVYKKVDGLLGTNIHVHDFSGLTVNGGTVNINIEINQIPTVGTVTFS